MKNIDQYKLLYSQIRLDRLAFLLITFSPLFYLSINHWLGNVIVLGVFLAVISFLKNALLHEILQITNVKNMICVFTIYPMVIFISQLCRWNWKLHPYHDVAPFLLGIPILFFFIKKRINVINYWRYLLPLCLMSGFLSSSFFEMTNKWGVERVTLYFMDPLLFGLTSLTLGLMCLAYVDHDFRLKHFTIKTIFSLMGFCTGLYLSINSGSRTGWMAIPITILFLGITTSKSNSIKKLIFSSLVIFLLLFTLFTFSPMFHDRIYLAWHEISSYPWSGGIAPETSVGLRITFQRLGLYYFSQSPLFGWGDHGYAVIKDAQPLLTFSSQFARDFAFSALFHNEWMTQSVRYGILGLIGVLIVFLIPGRIFYQASKDSFDKDISLTGKLGMVFMICQFCASFSDEVFNLKGAVTFNTIILACLTSGILVKEFKPT